MDNASQPDVRRSGGDLEPVDRSSVLKAQLRLPNPHRFELRDPFAEVTYRSNSFEEMAAKAEKLQAVRFTLIDSQGKRSEVRKQDGHWPRPAVERPFAGTSAPERQAQAAGTSPPAPKQDAALSEQDDQAKRSARLAHLKVQLDERYVVKHSPLRIGDVTIGQTEYRLRGDISRVAFTESTFRLSTDTNSPSVARSMVDVAEVRGWHSIRVSGSDDFKRMVWQEASLRHIKAVGYEPVPGDLDRLRKSRDSHLATEPARARAQSNAASSATKQSGRGGSRKAVLAALESLLVARRVPAAQREAVMAAAAENLSQRLRNGERLRVKVYDRAAPSQRPTTARTREPHRGQDRPGPSR